MSRRLLLVIVVALAVPAVALAARIAPPKAGRWNTGVDFKGGFVVTGEHISGFHITGSNCNLGEITIPGKQPMHYSTVDGYSNWLIGTSDPTRKKPNDISGVVGQRVTLKTGGKKLSGLLEITFGILQNPKDNAGDLRVSGCDIPFDPARA